MNGIANQRQILNRRSLKASVDVILGEKGYDTKRRPQIVQCLKGVLHRGQEEVLARFETNGSGPDVFAGNAFLTDQLVRVIFEIATERVYPTANKTTSEQLSVVAIGGYGRGELAPHSDVDLMFLQPYKQTPYIEQVVEFILYMLWDLGLKVGHSTRSIDDCLRLSKRDVTIQTSLLDARWVWGDQDLFGDFYRRFQAEVVEGQGPKFVEDKLAERDGRHERMGDTRYVVEPNIKEGKGGLRDLQTLYWLTKFLYGVSNVADLVPLGVFTPQDVNRFTKAQDFLWTVRCHLHYLAGRPEERLTFDVQKTISERMTYADREGISDVERFMKHYFLIAKDVGDLTRVLCAVLEDQQKKRSLFRLPSLTLLGTKVDGFQVDRGRITVDSEDAFRMEPLKLLRIFAEAQEHDLDIHPQALRFISNSLNLIGHEFRQDPKANELFMRIMTSRKEPEKALRRLNEAGVFGKFVPDFGRVVAQMQFDMYHTYTVDEHTIRALGILSRIESGAHAHDMPNVTQAMKEVHSRRALYVAVFLHDIAKGRGGDHSEIGAGLALELCPRFGLSGEETETVSWLVREHLTMSDTAFKRDVEDPQTIKGFLKIVKSVERLRLLTVLTCADIRAVGPSTWTNWKSGLLRGLYLRTIEALSADMVTENRTQRIALAKERLRDALIAWPVADIDAHMAMGYPGYWLSYDHDTLVRHANIVRKARAKRRSLLIESRVDDEFEYSEITIYAPDHPGIFSEMAGAMALSGVTIVDAKIATMSNGMVLDSFAVLDAQERAVTRPEKLKRIYQRIENVFAGKLQIKQELETARQGALSRREEPFSVASRVIIDNKLSATNTIIEVNGRDRVGFLYDVTSVLTGLGLKISSAHITTFGEEVVDTFYVKDIFGLKVTHDSKIEKIREALMEAVASKKESFSPDLLTELAQGQADPKRVKEHAS